MAGLQLGTNYINSYEAAHDLLQTTPYFRQDDWQEFAKRGELDNYIGVLSRADELPSFDQFAEENRFDLLDADKRYTYMANELLGDKTNVDTERTLTKYNDDGTITEYKQNMSDYDYTKYLLNQYKDYKIAEENRQIEQERKDDMNGFVKFLASVAGTAGEFTKGALDLVSGVVSIVGAPIGGIVTAAQGDGFNKGEREVLGGALDISDNIGLTEALDKFERENTFLKDLDGNLTSFGKIFGQTAYSFGQIIIPGVIGKALSAAGVSANIAGKISTGIYYTGMTGNNIKDMINDPRMATVPTWEIIFNAAAKSAVEYAIQVGVSKIFGTSTIDKLIGIGGSSTQGIFSKLGISARGGLARVGLEFVNEGVEEMLQQFSNVLVDDFFGIFEQNFGQLSDWNFQTMFDAFVLGGIGGAFAGSFRMMTMRRTPDIKQRYSEKSGFKVYNWFKSKLANYEYINRYSDVAQLYDNIMNDSKMTSEERIVATEQMYSAMRVFGAYYNQIGEQRMQAAEQMLTTMKQYSRSLYDDSKNIKKTTTQIFTQLGNMRIDEQNAIIEKMKAAAMTSVDNIVTRNNIDTIDDQDLLNKTKQYFNDNPDADYIVYTRDGKNVISFKNATFVPIEYMKNLDSNSVLKNQAEQTVVDAIQNAKGLTVTLDEIYTVFKKVTGREDVTNQEIIYNLLFNESFQRILLTTANREVYRVLAHLKDIVNNATRKTVKDAIFKERMQQTYDALAKNLVDYLINQQTAYYDNLSILTKEQKAYIKNQRYSKDLANRVRNNEKLSQDDYSVLENRVNSMPATDEVRQEVIENLHSDEQTARNNAMNVIERYYRNIFNSPYDNKTYLELSSQGNAVFDEFLRNLGKTLDTLLDVKANSVDAQIIAELYNEVNRQTIIRYYRDQFAEFTNGNYDFTISKGQFIIHENESVRQQGFDNFIEQHKQIRGNYANIKGRTFTDIRQNAAFKYLNTVINKNVDIGTRSTLDVRDLVYNSNYLTKKAKQEIEEQYGSITPINTFLYLRNRFLEESGNTVSIIVTPEYDFVIVDVKPMIQMFKDEEFKVQTKNEVSISDYIKSEYLTGRLADTKVRLGDENEYNPTSNIITVKKDTPAKVRVAIAHEFQHAIQVANNLNGGLDYNWLSNMTKRQQRAIINDIHRHRPELFETIVEGKKQNVTRGSELEFEIARNFIYDSTGESQAYGAEGRDIVDYYPVITRRQGDSVSLITPWGSIYNVNGNMSQVPKYDFNDINDINIIKQLLPNKNISEWLNLNYTDMVRDIKGPAYEYYYGENNDTELSINGQQLVEELTNIPFAEQETIETKKKIYNFSDKDIEIMKRDAWFIIAPTISFEEFLQLDIPYIRFSKNIQNHSSIYNSVTLLSTVKDLRETSIRKLKDFLFSATIGGTNNYIIYIGTVKAKDLMAFFDNYGMNEGIVSDNILSKAEIYNYNYHNDVLTNLSNMSQAPEYDKLVNEYAKRTYNTQMTPNSLTGFIFPDGYVGFSETMWTHEQFYQDLAKQFGARADLFKDNLVEIALNTNRFSGAYVDSMTIRVNGKLNADQRTALYDFVSDALANDAQIEIEDIPSGRYAGSEPGDYNARRLLARAGISIGGGSMSMAQPGDKRTRRIKADVWKDTNLKYFNKRQGVDPRIQDLVINLDPAQTEPDLWEFIGGNRKGELNMWTLQEYIRNASRMNDYTFNKINQYVYQNNNIKTFNELQRLVDSFDIYFALSVAIRSIKNTNKLDLLNRKISYKNARKLYDQVATDPRTERAVNKSLGYFNGYIDTRSGKAKYVPIELDLEAARISLLKRYDGTINSIVNIAMRAKASAILYNEHPYYRQRSGRGQTVSADEQIDESRSRIDFIADDSAQNAFNEVIYGYTREQMIDKILDYTIEQAAMRGQIIKNTDALRAAIERHSTDTIENMFVELDLADDMGVKVNNDMIALTPDENVQEQVAKNVNKNSIIKRPSSYKQSIIQFAQTIRNRLSLREFKKLPEDVQQMFDKNGMLKSESYQNKSREELIQLKELMKEIAAKAKRGEFEVKSDDLLRKEIKQLQKENKQLDKEIKNRPIVEKTINLANHEFTINSDAEMPNVLRQMINTSFETFADTDVKYLTGSDEKHLKLSLNEFTNKNAMRLSGLTSGDAEAIIDYFNNAIVISNEQSLKIFNAIKMYTLAAVYDLARQGQFVLSSDYITRIKEIMRAAGSQAGTDLAVFRNVIETFNPSKQIIQSMARSNGIEFDEQLVDDMIDALSKNDIAKARVIKEQMYQDVLAKAKKGKVRRTIWDKLIAFERMAMLSSPGTWVRNITSNYTVTFMNEIGGKLGKLFTGKFKKNVQGQYQITDTKTTQEVYDFIKTNVEDSGLFALIKEGLNKWDPRVTAQKSKTASQLTQMIMSTVENEVFSHSFNEGKGVKNTGYLLETFMSKVLSDNRWIDKRFKSYLGKMLTEDVKNGTVLAQKPTSENKLKPIDLSHGLTPDIMNIVADAYKLAAYDYMHRFNTFSKIDATIRERGGNAVYFLWKQIMPFAAASWNWFIEGLSYTPIGLAKSIVDFARMEKTIDKLDYQRRKGDDVISSSFVRYLAQRNIGKGAIGTIGFLIGMMLGGFGVAEVDEEDEKVKLHIGDIWLDITNLTGTQGILLGMMVMNPSKGDAWDAIVQVADTLANDSTLESLFNLFRYSNSVGEFVVSYPMTIAGMFVPNALKAFNALIQPNKIKYSQGFKGDLEYFAQSLIPGFSYALNMRTDPFTGETQTKFNVPFIIDFLNRMTPIKLYNYRVSELEKKVLELQAQSGESLTTNELTGRYSDIGQLNGEDVVKLNQKYGELNNKILTQFFNNKIVVRVQNEDGTFSELRYNQMTNEQRANAYNSLTSKNATYAKIYVWTQAGNKYYATNEMFDILRELGIRQNVYREVGKKTGFVK